MGCGASKSKKKVKVSQEPSSGTQEGQSDGNETLSRQKGLLNEQQSSTTNLSKLTSREQDQPTLKEQPKEICPSGQPEIPKQSQQPCHASPSEHRPVTPNHSPNLHVQSFSGLASGHLNSPAQQQFQEEQQLNLSGPKLEQSYPLHEDVQRQQDGNWQEGCQLLNQHRQHPSMQGEDQMTSYAMQGGFQQPVMQGGFQQPVMQRGFHQQGFAMQEGVQQQHHPMQGGFKSQGCAMQGRVQQPGYVMQGRMQPQSNVMHEGMLRQDYAMERGMQLQDNVMQADMQPQNYATPRGMLPQVNAMHGRMQQHGYVIQGGMQPQGNVMHHPEYVMQAAIHPPYAMKGGMQLQDNVMEADMQPHNYATPRGMLPQGNVAHGGIQQHGYGMQGGMQPQNNVMQGRMQHQDDAMQGGMQPQSDVMRGGVQQRGNVMQGGMQPQGNVMHEGMEQRVCATKEGFQPHGCAIQGVQQHGYAMQGHETNRILEKEEQRPNQCFPKTSEPQQASKPPQPQDEMCYTIHVAVDPVVMEYVSSSRHNHDLEKVTKEKQITLKFGTNNVALEYSGEKSKSWKEECVDAVLSFFNRFEKCDVEVPEEVGKEVQDELCHVRTNLGRDSPLLKFNEDKSTTTIVALRADIEYHKGRLTTQVEKLYKKATFQSKTISHISKSHLSLLKTVNFLEHLQKMCPDVEIDLDQKKREIRLQGPEDQVDNATREFRNQQHAATEKYLTLSNDEFLILNSEEGKSLISKALNDHNIQAVVEFHASKESVTVLGTSDKHAKKAISVISGMVAEEKLSFSTNHLSLTAGESWSNLCEKVQEKKSVLIRKSPSGEIWVVGFKSNVIKAVQKLQFYLDNNAESEEEIECTSRDAKEYLLRCVSSKQDKFEIKVRDVDASLSFYISGREQGIEQTLDMIKKLLKDMVILNKVFKQPGLKHFLKTDDLNVRVKKVEDQENCYIRIEEIPGSARTTLPSQFANSAGSELVLSSGSNTLTTVYGHTISWKSGDILKEQADVLVIPQGVCFDALKGHLDQGTIQAAAQLRIGDIAIFSSLNLSCTHVIYCCCSSWNNNGEKNLRTIVERCIFKGDELRNKSIAFPIIGTGVLGFPPREASRIMLDETTKSCVKLPQTTLKDIRFVLYYKDQSLISAFQQETMQFQHQWTTTPAAQSIGGTDRLEIKVIQGDVTKETTEAIVNVIGSDMNMDTFGQLSRIIAKNSGPQVQQELNQKRTQLPGSAVMTSGGNLAARYIIHIVPGSSDKQHLQTCLEEVLRLADATGLQSISVPAIGAGGFGLSAMESAQLIFQALSNMYGTFSSLSTVRIVVFQNQMIHAFQQEQQKLLLPSLKAAPSPPSFRSQIKVDVVKGDLTQERNSAIVNVVGPDLNMNNFGELSRVVARASGSQVQQELNQRGTQPPGSAVMTSGGALATKHIIHIVPGYTDKQHLQTCLEEGLRLGDATGLQSISVPAIGTGGFGLSATESAQLIFQTLSNMDGTFSSLSTVRIVVFQNQMIQAFQQEQQKFLLPSLKAAPSPPSFRSQIKVDVVKGDLTQERNSAIVNVVGPDLNMNNFGELSRIVARASGSQVQQELNQRGTQPPGSAVMTSGGALATKHIIHIVPGYTDKQHLQTCLEEGLRLGDATGLQSISVPAIGTGGFGLSAKESAQLIFQALSNMEGNFVSISSVRIVVFHDHMVRDFQEEQQNYSLRPVMVASHGSSPHMMPARQSSNLSARVWVTGGNKDDVKKAIDELQELFSSVCITKRVSNEGISSLSEMQIGHIKREANKYEIEIVVDKAANCLTVRGFSADIPDMVNKITDEISKAIKNEKQEREDDQAHLISKVVEWSYMLNGKERVFDKKTNSKLELAHSKNQPRLKVKLNGKEFVVDLKNKTGRCQTNNEQISVTRTLKEGIPLPDNWTPMPLHEPVILVPLSITSAEYQDVLSEFQKTVSGVNIQKIERVQNPDLYRTYMAKKQEMDKRYGANSERKLFHGTYGKNINPIINQGFNRSYCGVNGTLFGRGVYFARDASYSLRYAGGAGGGGAMYLARVLVGKYCQGKADFIVPPPKDPTRPDILYDSVVDNPLDPTIFVVFFDPQTYPQYIITL